MGSNWSHTLAWVIYLSGFIGWKCCPVTTFSVGSYMFCAEPWNLKDFLLPYDTGTQKDMQKAYSIQYFASKARKACCTQHRESWCTSKRNCRERLETVHLWSDPKVFMVRLTPLLSSLWKRVYPNTSYHIESKLAPFWGKHTVVINQQHDMSVLHLGFSASGCSAQPIIVFYYSKPPIAMWVGYARIPGKY